MALTLFRCINECFEDMLDHCICSFEEEAGIVVPDEGSRITLTPSYTVQYILDGATKTVQGNCTLVLRDIPYGPAMRIPINNGRLCRDRNQWEQESRKLKAKIYKHHKTGFAVSLGDSTGFLPNSLIPENQSKQFAKIGYEFECVVVGNDGQHPVVIKPLNIQS